MTRPIAGLSLLLAAALAGCEAHQESVNTERPAGAGGGQGWADSVRSDQAKRQRAAAAHVDSIPQAVRDSMFEAVKDTLAVLVAGNTEPFWRVDITRTGVRYWTVKDCDAILFQPDTVAGTDSLSTWRAHRTGRGPKALMLRLLRQVCRDPKSDATFPYTSFLTVDGHQWDGCAVPTTANQIQQ